MEIVDLLGFVAAEVVSMVFVHQAFLMSIWTRMRVEIHVYETRCFTAAGIIYRLVKGSLLPIGGTLL